MPRPRRRSPEEQIAEILRSHTAAMASAITDVIRTQVAEEMLAHFADAAAVVGGGAKKPRVRAARILRTASGVRDMSCIAPGCSNVSKGPRLHYLCADHVGASKAEYTAWRKAKKAAQE
jgi:hypothetical protein